MTTATKHDDTRHFVRLMLSASYGQGLRLSQMVDDHCDNEFTSSIMRLMLSSSFGQCAKIAQLVDDGYDNIEAINSALRTWRLGRRSASEQDGYIPTVQEIGGIL